MSFTSQKLSSHFTALPLPFLPLPLANGLGQGVIRLPLILLFTAQFHSPAILSCAAAVCGSHTPILPHAWPGPWPESVKTMVVASLRL